MSQTPNQAVLASIESHIPSLRRYACALVRNRDQADDLVQDCLARALSRAELFTPGTNLRTWLFTILHNEYVSWLRRLKRRGVSVPIDEWQMAASCGPGQEEAIELRDFKRAFRRLSDAEQRILLLIGLEGLSYEEAAEVLGVVVGTVKSRLFRAREKLLSIQLEMNKSGMAQRRASTVSRTQHALL